MMYNSRLGEAGWGEIFSTDRDLYLAAFHFFDPISHQIFRN